MTPSRFLSIATAILTAGALAFPPLAAAQSADSGAPLRGGAFEIGPVTGVATFSDKARLDACRWQGLRVGHRFDPFPGLERLQAEFRAGWEGCFTTHEEVGSVDLIHLQLSWMLGLSLSRKWRVYWGAGVGELLADSTPGDDNQVLARFSVHLSPGVTWALSKRWLIDASLTGIVFENYDFGSNPVGGTTIGFLPSLFVAVQI